MDAWAQRDAVECRNGIEVSCTIMELNRASGELRIQNWNANGSAPITSTSDISTTVKGEGNANGVSGSILKTSPLGQARSKMKWLPQKGRK